jgi:nucleoside-diphosphate-sugar epimerase
MSFMKNTGKALADVIPGLGKFTFDDSPGKIFITSGTGVIGYRVAVSLLEAGHTNVRVGVWKGDRQGVDDERFAERFAGTLEAKGAEIIDFNWADPAGKFR